MAASSVTSADVPPPNASATGDPKAEASQPARSPPTGVEPANTVMYTLITRPRSLSGTASWMAELAVAVIAIAPAPATNTAASDTGNNRIPREPELEHPQRDTRRPA